MNLAAIGGTAMKLFISECSTHCYALMRIVVGFHRTDRRHSGDDRAVHALGGLHSQWPDGIRLLDRPRDQGAVAAPEPGRTGRALLLRLSLHCCPGKWYLEYRLNEEKDWG